VAGHLRLGKSTLLHSNLLVDVTEKILLPNPLQKRGDYPGISFRSIGTTTDTELYIKTTADISAKTTGILVNNTLLGARVISSGNIDAQTGDGISVRGFHGGTLSKSIVIESSGRIDASGFGIKAIYAELITITNSGKMTAATKDGVYGQGVDIRLTNTSKSEIIADAGQGIFLDGFTRGGSMRSVNDGMIQSKETGIHLRPREDIRVDVSGSGNITSASRSGIYI